MLQDFLFLFEEFGVYTAVKEYVLLINESLDAYDIEYIAVLVTTLIWAFLTALLIYLFYKGVYMIVRWLVQW